MAKEKEDRLLGRIRLGAVTAINTKTFRCEVSFPDSIGGATNVIFNPSPAFGHIPRVGTICAIYDKPGHAKRLICSLSEISSRTPSEIAVREDTYGTVPRMESDDVYIGRHGRAYFNSNGDVSINSRKNRAGLDLKYDKARSELYGYNFQIFTPGKGINVHSGSAVYGTVGDEFYIDKAVPVPPSPDNLPDPIIIPITQFKIDSVGNTGLRVGALVQGSTLAMSIVGEIGLRNPLAELNLHANADIELKNQTVSLDLVADDSAILQTSKSEMSIGTDGGMVISGPGASLEIEASGRVLLANQSSEFEMFQAGGFDLSATSGGISLTSPSASLGLPQAGQASLISTGGAIIDGASLVKLQGALIQLGQTAAFHPALAEPISIILTVVSDFCLKVQAHTHVVTGSVISGLGAGGIVAATAGQSSVLAAAIPPPPGPTPLIGSNTVTIQG